MSGDQDDIFLCDPITLGETSACTFSNFWDGDIEGFANWRLSGLHITGLQAGGGPTTPVIDPITDPEGDGSYTISWSSVTDAVAYQLEASPDGADGYWRTLLHADQTSDSAAAPTPGSHCYRVRATYSNQASSWSDAVCISAATAGPPPAPAPQPTTTTVYYGRSTTSDIVAFDLATATTSVYFDGSDVGLLSKTVDAFHLEADGSILLSLGGAVAVPGIVGQVQGPDILRFVPVTLGATTVGTFELLLDASDVNLTGLVGACPRWLADRQHNRRRGDPRL